MSARVCVIEDEQDLCTLLDYNLRKEGFEVTLVSDGDDALAAVTDERPDIVLLDWMLPNRSGIEICRAIRARAELRDTPVIMLTARGAEDDRIRGLKTGADDYVTKPFSMSELSARIQAVLRRAKPQVAEDVLEFGDIRLDRSTHRVTRGKRAVNLGPTEFKLLDVLMQRPGRVLGRDMLLDRVWGRDIYVEVRTVDVHIGRLRAKLNRRGDTDPIRTVRAMGYAMDETYPASLKP